MSPRTKFSIRANVLLVWLISEAIDGVILLAVWLGWEVLS